MPEQDSKGLLARLRDMPPDSLPKTVAVAVALCLCASMIVSAAAVALRPIQDANRLRDKQINVLQVAGVYEPGIDVAEAFAAFEPHVLELETGQFTDEYDIETFDELATSSDPALVRALDEDPAGIGTQLKYEMIYLLRDEGGGDGRLADGILRIARKRGYSVSADDVLVVEIMRPVTPGP